MHYLGREYMYYKKWPQAISTFHRHLELKSATWKDERCASMRFMARCYLQLNFIEEAKLWFQKAIEEAPYLRDPLIERGLLAYQEENWQEVIFYITQALKIKNHAKSYINEPFSWDSTPYDLLSIAYFEQQDYDLAHLFCQKALKLNSTDKRIQQNLKIINEEIEKNSRDY